MRIEFDKARREALARTLAVYLRDELEVTVGGLDAMLLLDFIAERLGPHFYNQGIEDARVLLSKKVDVLADALYELEKPVKP